jgi:hypothetical protein
VPPRLQKLIMRLKAHSAAVMALAFVQLCTAPLFAAKPTRSIPRESSRRLVLAPTSSRETARSRTAHHLTHANWVGSNAPHHASTPSHATRHTREIAATRPTGRPTKHAAILTRAEAHAAASYAAADSTTLDRVHIWEQTHRNPPADAKPIAPASQADDTLAETPSGLLRTDSELAPIKTIDEEAATPVFLHSLYDSRGRLVVPAPLFGSHEVLLHQNQMADREGLSRVQDDNDLLDLRRDKQLVALPVSEGLRVDERLPENRRFSRPWTADFLAVLAHDYYNSFHEPLQVNSAVRTVDFQKRLLRTNGNAAPAAGDTASPHLTGQAIDIGKHGLTMTEIAWMRAYLQPLIDQGKIDVEEEFQQSCFHISVYKNYLPTLPTHLTVASRQPLTAPAF